MDRHQLQKKLKYNIINLEIMLNGAKNKTKMRYILRNVVRLFIRKPKETLNWTDKDFEKAKRYCKYENHPISKDLTLWDYIYNEQDDSVWTIHKLNVHLGLR